MLKLRQPALCLTVLAVFLLQPLGAFAQQAPAAEGIGVVTTLQGQATVGRQPLPQPVPLHFKDDVFFQDQIATRERSTVRLLLGGKGTITIREQSRVTLDETVAPDGTRRSVVGLLVGKIGAAIARGLMQPGEVIEIQTPNAVAAVRGTVLIAEYIPPQGSAQGAKPVLLASSVPGPFFAQAGGAGGASNFYVVSGQVTITPQGQAPVTLGPMQAVSVTATPAGVQAGAVQNVTATQINDAAQGLQTGKTHTGEAEANATAQAQLQVAAALANAIVSTTTQTQTTIQGLGPQQQAATNNTVTPVTPQPPASPASPDNTLPAVPLLTLNNATLGLAAGTSLATFNAGTANTIIPIEISGGGIAVVTAPLLPVTGDTITHDGPMVSMQTGATLVGSPTDTTTPLVSMEGTTLTNTGGPVFTLSGDALLTFFGPLLSLAAGATAELAGIMALGDTSQVALGPASAVLIPAGTTLKLTAPGFSLTGGSQLNTFADEEGSGGHLVSLSSGTLILEAPLLSLTAGPSEETPTVNIAGDVLHIASTVTGPPSGSLVDVGAGSLTATGDLVNLGAESTLDLSGSVLTVNGGEVAVGNVLNVGAPLTTPSGQPMIHVTGGTLNTTGSLATLGANLTLGGALLAQSGGAVTTGADALAVGSHTLTSGSTPVFDLTGGTLTTQNGGHLVSLSGGTANFGGPLLSLAMGPSESTPTVSIAGDLLNIASTVTGPPSGSLVSATAGRLTSGGDFFHVGPGGRLSVGGGLVAATDSILTAATGISGGGSPGVPPLWEPNFGSLVPNGRCDDCTTGLPGVALGFSFPFQGQNFTNAVVSGNGFLWLGGDQGSQCCNPSVPDFLAGLGRVSIGWTDWDPRFGVGGVKANTIPGRAVFTWDGVPEFSGSDHPNSTFQIQLLSDGRIVFGYQTLHPLTSHDLLIGVTPGGGVTDPGEVHFLTAVPFNTGTTGSVYELFTTGESFGLDGVALVFTPNASGGWDVSTTGSSLGGLGGAVLSILDGGELTQSGNAALFDLVRTALTSNGDFLRMLGQSRLSLGGRLLNATDSPIAIARSVVNILGGGQLLSTTLDSLVQTTGGSLTLAGLASIPVEGGTLNFTTGSFLQMSSPDPEAMASLTVAGGLLHSSGTPISGQNHFLDIGSNAHVTSTGADPAVVLVNSPLTIAGVGSFTTEEGTASSPFGNFLNICCTNSMTLTSPLLLATESPLTVAGALVSVFGGGRLASTTTDSLVKLVGGTHEIGSATFTGTVPIGPQVFAMPASLLDLRGINTDAAGLGTDPVLQTGGTIFEASGATVNLSGTGNAISVDTALLAAAAPVVKLINSTLNTSSTGNPDTGAMHLYQSSVTSLGPVFGLDNSTLNVHSGPLLSLTGGSNMTVTGDFASLINGSKIHVFNGPLISVDGVNLGGTPSTLNVSGALVNFGGTGGNQIVVNNSIAPTATMSGLPVNVGNGGSSISIGPNPIKSPGLGTVSVTCPGDCSGSLIRASNGGRVTITAP